MGTYRLLLAVLVVLFHFGGMSALTGRTAVFGFYALSGYLMLLVLDRVYSRATGGTRKFYANRLLRIYPPYLLFVALTAVVVAAHGVSLTFGPGNTGALLNPAVAHYGVLDYLRELAFGNHSWRTPANAGAPNLIPQAWSLGVEMIFYALAPLLLLLGRSWKRWVAVALPLLAYDVTTLALGLPLDEWRYKSFLGSALVFLAGAALYRFRDSVPRVPRAPLVAAAGALVLLAVLHRLVGPPTNARFYALVVFEVLLTAVVVQVRPSETWKGIDRFLGNISYGVFVGHYLAGFLLLAAQERQAQRGESLPFGPISSTRFGLSAAALAIVLATACYLLVERPLERYRDRVRGRERRVLNVEAIAPTATAPP
jgi:peptidoglycan/LPS O-acetylase OafA/YrhL